MDNKEEQITKDDIKLWKEDRVTKALYRTLFELQDRAHQFLQSESNLYKPNSEKLYAHTYGSLWIIRLLKDAIELETIGAEEQKTDERY
jgi:hypothetical protein